MWRFPTERHVLSSAPVGGGRGSCTWLANVGVTSDYGRVDLDAHVAEVAAACGVAGAGVGLLTAADVRRVRRGEDGEVVAHATVGVTRVTWAADADGACALRDEGWRQVTLAGTGPGTINLVVQVPVRLSEAAAVNAIATATEAKCQALLERGIPGTGTASDAVAILWRADGPAEPFAGPRSWWGARVARAVHAAVTEGLDTHP